MYSIFTDILTRRTTIADMSSTEGPEHPDSDTDESLSESDIDSSVIDPFEDTSYAALSRGLLNDVVARLHNCGVGRHIDLPKIAVIGDQSSGKSSLIEAISQVKVPRSADTCTRCPMEVILHRGSGKKEVRNYCISLRKEYDNDGQRVGMAAPIFFAETQDRKEVTDLLRRAQLAILNPQKNPDFFDGDNLNYRDEESLDFSWNKVVLEITGADVDITFIDLPGFIPSPEKVI
jgi:hypothetical protein